MKRSGLYKVLDPVLDPFTEAYSKIMRYFFEVVSYSIVFRFIWDFPRKNVPVSNYLLPVINKPSTVHILKNFSKMFFFHWVFSLNGRLRAQTKRSVSDPDHLPWVYHFVSDKTNALHTRTSFAKNNHSHTGVLLNICCVWHYKNWLSLYLNFKWIMKWIFFFLYHLKKTVSISFSFLFQAVETGPARQSGS